MPHQHTSNNRREFLELGVAFSAAALAGSTVFAEDNQTEAALRFLITLKGRKFGVKIMPLANGAGLLTVRELNTKRRYAHAFKFNDNSADNSCKLTFNKNDYQVVEQDDWFATNVPGVTIGSPELRETEPGAGGESPDEGLSPQKRAFLRKLLGAISGAIEAIGVAIAIVVVIVRGGTVTFQLRDGTISVETRKEGGADVKLEDQDNFMPPPPGTEERPDVWY